MQNPGLQFKLENEFKKIFGLKLNEKLVKSFDLLREKNFNNSKIFFCSYSFIVKSSVKFLVNSK